MHTFNSSTGEAGGRSLSSEFMASLVYIAHSRTARTKQSNPDLKNKNKETHTHTHSTFKETDRLTVISPHILTLLPKPFSTS